jgi:hypothetical protein
MFPQFISIYEFLDLPDLEEEEDLMEFDNLQLEFDDELD